MLSTNGEVRLLGSHQAKNAHGREAAARLKRNDILIPPIPLEDEIGAWQEKAPLRESRFTKRGEGKDISLDRSELETHIREARASGGTPRESRDVKGGAQPRCGSMWHKQATLHLGRWKNQLTPSL